MGSEQQPLRSMHSMPTHAYPCREPPTDVSVRLVRTTTQRPWISHSTPTVQSTCLSDLGRTDRWGQEREDQAEQGKAREDPGGEGVRIYHHVSRRPRGFHAEQDIKPLPRRVVLLQLSSLSSINTQAAHFLSYRTSSSNPRTTLFQTLNQPTLIPTKNPTTPSK